MITPPLPQAGPDKALCSLTSDQEDNIRILARRVGDEVCAKRNELPPILTEEHGVEWKVDETGYRSPVTPLDRHASDILVEGLKTITPAIPTISEEMSLAEQQWVLKEARETAKKNGKKGPTYWLVDPIDGTNPFLTNEGHYAVLIGLIEEGRPTFGVVYFPKLNLMFFTHAGRAWQSKSGVMTPIQVAAPPLPAHEGAMPIRMKMIGKTRLENRMNVEKYGFKIALTEPPSTDIPHGDVQLLRGELDLTFAHRRYPEWDKAAYLAVMEAAGLAYASDETGQSFIFGNDDNLRTPTHWLGHPSLLRRLQFCLT
jgi:3'-phosphoadenosine 5'-phosphosulfate (PAPS) 3'-phosphatase